MTDVTDGIATEMDGDPFASLKDASLKLKPKDDDFPELPEFLDRRITGRVT